MIKNNFKFILCAVFAALIISSLPLRVAYAESTTILTDEQKKALVKQVNQALSALNETANSFQNKLQTFKSKTYSYQLNEATARERAKDQSDFYMKQNGKSHAEQLQDHYEKKLKDLMAKTYNEEYDSFIEWTNGAGTAEMGWTSDEKATASRNNISLKQVDFNDTDLYWDKVIGKADTQAKIERNPERGAGAAIKSAQELDSIKSQLSNQHGAVQSGLAALNPTNSISGNCTVEVPEGQECPPDKMTYTVVNADGKSTTGASKGCTPLPVKYAEIQTCILCPLFQVILRTDQTMATKSYSALAGSFRNLIIVVMALFVAFQTLLTVSAFTKQDAPKYITTLLVQAFKVFVAVLLLSNSTYIYQYVINPLMQAGLEFGLALLFSPTMSSTEFASVTAQYAPGMPTGVISKELLGSVMAAVKLFNKAAAQLPAIGSSLICISVHEGTSFVINISMFIQGLLVYAFGWAIALTCCFYLLDSVVRFGMFCALLPFLIASWPFKVTARYTKTGWDIFMNAFFNFVMMGLIISINTELISQALSGGKGGLDALEAAINGSNVDALKEMMDLSGVDFLILVACCMFAFKLVAQVNGLATEMAGGGGSQSIGGKIGGAAAQAVKKVGGVAASGGKAIGGAAYEGSRAKASVDNVKGKAMNKMASAGAKVGLGKKTNPNGAGGAGK